jgi:hypothetical protein
MSKQDAASGLINDKISGLAGKFYVIANWMDSDFQLGWFHQVASKVSIKALNEHN